MAQIEQHNIKTLSHFAQLQFPNKSIKILLSISAFSILFSCFPFLPLISHSISTFSTFTADRNYIFLFCNGILVFLIRNSVLEGPSPEPVKLNVDENHQSMAGEEENMEFEEGKGNENWVIEENMEFEEGKGNENWVMEIGKENGILATQDGNEEVYEEEELLSAEELNKKCDEFIRKMREGIKFESQQPIMV